MPCAVPLPYNTAKDLSTGLRDLARTIKEVCAVSVAMLVKFAHTLGIKKTPPNGKQQVPLVAACLSDSGERNSL